MSRIVGQAYATSSAARVIALGNLSDEEILAEQERLQATPALATTDDQTPRERHLADLANQAQRDFVKRLTERTKG